MANKLMIWVLLSAMRSYCNWIIESNCGGRKHVPRCFPTSSEWSFSGGTVTLVLWLLQQLILYAAMLLKLDDTRQKSVSGLFLGVWDYSKDNWAWQNNTQFTKNQGMRVPGVI